METPKIFHLGTQAAHALPRGKDNNWATIPLTVIEGNRKKKNWLRPGMTMDQIIPMVHARIVETGMFMSSVLATAERTSG